MLKKLFRALFYTPLPTHAETDEERQDEYDHAYGWAWTKLRHGGADPEQLRSLGQGHGANMNAAIWAAIADHKLFEEGRKQKEHEEAWVRNLVPSWASSYAKDENGVWYAYEGIPEADEKVGMFDTDGMRYTRISDPVSQLNWRGSLREIRKSAPRGAKPTENADAAE